MIRIKGYGLFNRLSFVIFYTLVLGMLARFASFALKIDDLETKLIVGVILLAFVLILTGFAFLIWWDMGRNAIGADVKDHEIQFVMMTGRVRSVNPDSIVKVIKAVHGYRLVDDRRQSYILSYIFWPKTPYNPWRELIKPSLFQNAEFKEQLYYW